MNNVVPNRQINPGQVSHPSTHRQDERGQQTRGPQNLAQLNLKYERKIKKSSFLAPHYLLNQRGVLCCGHVAVLLLLLVAQLSHLWRGLVFVAPALPTLHPLSPPSRPQAH